MVMQAVLAGDAFAATFMEVMPLAPLGAMRIACPSAVLQRRGGAERVARDFAGGEGCGQGPRE
eukprot:2905853-Pyramimonas_sp.AAC.1